MVIDVDKKYILTNYKQAKNGGKATDSDHFTEYMDLNLQFVSEKPIRKEIFNFKEPEALERFRDITTNTNTFSECFLNDLPLEKQIDNWRKTLKSHCQMAFKKIRIKQKKHMKPVNPTMSALIDERNELHKNIASVENVEKVRKIEENISNMEAEEKYALISEQFNKFSENPESINLQEVWKVLKKVCPKQSNTVPIAKRNHKGDLVTNTKEIKKLLAKEYKQRLRNRQLGLI